MSFDRFLLAVESRDLSQADKSLLFQFYKTSISEWWNLQLYQKKILGTWQFGKIDILVNFISKIEK